MRKCITCSMVLFASFSAMYGQEGQEEEGYQFTTTLLQR